MTTIYKVFDGNVANVLLTADHGFLYNDMKFEEKDKHSIKESAIEKKTRYYLTDSNDGFEDIVKFPLDKVSSIKECLYRQGGKKGFGFSREGRPACSYLRVGIPAGAVLRQR